MITAVDDCPRLSLALQYQELLAQCEKKQKDLKNLCVEESQQKRALAMRLDKESKQNIRRQKKREMKEQHVQQVLGYLTIVTCSISLFLSSLILCK